MNATENDDVSTMNVTETGAWIASESVSACGLWNVFGFCVISFCGPDF